MREPIARSVEMIRDNRDRRVARIEKLHGERINLASLEGLPVIEFKKNKFIAKDSYIVDPATNKYYRLCEDHPSGVTLANTKKIPIAWKSEHYENYMVLDLNRANGE
ncbi:MAG: hypothetical protein IK088_01260 [Lachnospiraceae bacterium]|nr:hypothetical protein [Lachnospiraceae bacterium]